MIQKVSLLEDTEERLSRILEKYRLKFFDDKVSSVIQLYEFDKMIGEILNQNIKCKFKNMKGYCKQQKNKATKNKYGMRCFEDGCPYYSAPC